jgi:hypothetical protein
LIAPKHPQLATPIQPKYALTIAKPRNVPIAASYAAN